MTTMAMDTDHIESTLDLSSLSLRIVDDLAGLEVLKTPWNELLESSTNTTVFNSWEWASCWWKHYGHGHSLRICIIEEHGKVIAIAPFYLRESGIPAIAPLRTLMFIGSGGDTAPDYLDILCRQDSAVKVHELLIQFIFRNWQEWNRIDLTDIPSESRFHSALQAAKSLDSRLQCRAGESIYIVDFENDWDAQMTSFPTKKRTKIRSRRRHMTEKAQAQFGIVDDANSLNKAMDTLIELHHKRWDARSTDCSFSTESYNNFHRDLMRSFFSRGWLKLYYLKNDDGIFAMDYCFSFQGTIMQFQRGFDPQYYNLSPGDVLMMYSFEHAIENGFQTFDFLRGDYPHKCQFATRTKTTVCLQYHRRTVSTMVYNALRSLKRAVAPRIKAMLRPKAHEA